MKKQRQKKLKPESLPDFFFRGMKADKYPTEEQINEMEKMKKKYGNPWKKNKCKSESAKSAELLRKALESK